MAADVVSQWYVVDVVEKGVNGITTMVAGSAVSGRDCACCKGKSATSCLVRASPTSEHSCRVLVSEVYKRASERLNTFWRPPSYGL